MNEVPHTANDIGENHGYAVQAGRIDHISFSAAPERPPVPRQLPKTIPHFTGRAEHLAALDRVLAGGDTAPVCAVVGTAGVGKTSLVIRWAQEAQRHFPDGTLHRDLGGYGPGVPATAGEVLAGFLSALGTSPERIPPDLQAREGLYRTILAQWRVLIVLDNVSDVAQVRPLLPAGPGCAVVVTSRADLKGLEVNDGATRIPLSVFTDQEARELVRAMLGRERTEAEPDAVHALVSACAGLPLAVRIAVGRVATHPHLTITELVAELHDERWEVLSTPADGHNAVRTMFEWSYRRLSEDQSRMFRRLGLHPGRTIGAHAVAAADGLGLRAARNLLASLADQHLIEPDGPDRYTCHDLLRAYAADLAEHDDDRDEARRRLLEWYAHHVVTAYLTVYPGQAGLYPGAGLVTGGDPEITFAGPAEAWTWAEAMVPNVVPTVRAAAHHGLPGITMLLAGISVGLLSLKGRTDDALEVCDLGMRAARQIGDRRAECVLSQNLGQLYRNVGRWQESAAALESALALTRELAHPGLEAEVLSHIGWGHFDFGRHREALPLLEAALALCPDGEHGLRAFIEFCLSGVHSGLGDHDLGWRHAERCSALLEKARSLLGSHGLFAMAVAKQVAGAHAEAIELCERALDVEDEHDHPRNHALLLDTLGESFRHTGDRARAVACWREALAIFEERGDHRAPDLRKRLAAEVSAGAG